MSLHQLCSSLEPEYFISADVLSSVQNLSIQYPLFGLDSREESCVWDRVPTLGCTILGGNSVTHGTSTRSVGLECPA